GECGASREPRNPPLLGKLKLPLRERETSRELGTRGEPALRDRLPLEVRVQGLGGTPSPDLEIEPQALQIRLCPAIAAWRTSLHRAEISGLASPVLPSTENRLPLRKRVEPPWVLGGKGAERLAEVVVRLR